MKRAGAVAGALPAPGQKQFEQRLAAVRACPSEARFVFADATFARPAVKVLPGEFFAWDEDITVQTVLGSCVAVCLHDPQAGVGGMNHFLLPSCDDAEADASCPARYGVHAMELLINRMLKLGAQRNRFTAKVFGGASLIEGTRAMSVGSRNIHFVDQFMLTEQIPVLSRDVLRNVARRVVLLPASGKVFVKRLSCAPSGDLQTQQAPETFSRLAGEAGTVELFRP